jgi:hypothetical protein
VYLGYVLKKMAWLFENVLVTLMSKPPEPHQTHIINSGGRGGIQADKYIVHGDNNVQ